MSEYEPHNGVLWHKVAEMNLPERELIDSFDSEADFVNYMNRAPKIAWDSVKGTEMAKLKAKADEATKPKEDEEKPKAKVVSSVDEIKKKAKEYEDKDED